ncbi:MAG: 3'-5' exonuclease, partial [Planctomycetota bacterium]
IQAEIIFLLGQKHKNVCVCGDPNQSIYSFRGARIENILKFSAQYPNTKVIKLEQNFRSTQNILAAASNVVAHNQQKSEHFQLFSQKETGSPITVYICPSENVEATLISQKVQDFQSQGYDLKEMAVFYRVNAQSRNLENALVIKQIPYQIVGGTNFYQRKEIKDLLAYLRIAINPSDEISLLRILNVPPRGIGKTSLEHLKTLAVEEGQPFLWALQHATNIKINKKALSSIEAFLRILEEIKKNSSRIYETLALLIQQIKYRDYLASLEDHSSISRIANMDELLQAAIEFERTYPEQCGVEWFLEETALLSDIDQVKEEDRVTLMTLHSCKGLEFPIVFLVGMEVGLLPHAWSLDTIDGFEEERRLCYVGFTRAQKELILSRCETRNTHGFSQMYPESPFLREIPPSLIRVINLTNNPSLDEDAGDIDSEETSFSETLGNNSFRSGDLVRHPNLGYGKILRLRGPRQDRIATIKFTDGSEKQVRMRFAQLEKADWSDIGEAP